MLESQVMDIISIFGKAVAKGSLDNPDAARKLLLTGYRAQRFRLQAFPDRRLGAAHHLSARAVMDQVLATLSQPQRAAAVSLFVPCEPLQAAGCIPYSPELLSAFLAGTRCEQAFLDVAAQEGMPETLCSYHRVFNGALTSGLMPAPKFCLYTNVACDGNLITFPHLQRHFDIPGFGIDVPYGKTEEAVQEVAGQLQSMVEFIGDVTGTRPSDDAISEHLSRGQRGIRAYLKACQAQAKRRLPSDLTSQMYAVVMNHLLAGSEVSERYGLLMEKEAEAAPLCNGLRLVWLHVIPNMQPAACNLLDFTDDAFITAGDLACDPCLIEIDPAKPYDAMARRLVHSAFNGSIDERVSRALHMADLTNADGVVVFGQWGCKSTLGAAQAMKRDIEDAGMPCLILDGDGADTANASDGQTATRLGAFLEVLDQRRCRVSA